MACQRDCAAALNRFVDISSHPVWIQFNVGGAAASGVIVHAERRSGEPYFLTACRSLVAVVQRPREQNDFRSHKGREGPGTAKNEETGEDRVHRRHGGNNAGSRAPTAPDWAEAPH